MICTESDIINISNNKCIPNRIESRNSSCSTSNDHHIALIEEIDAGVILLNGFNGRISIDETNHTLIGTFIIKFHNSTINVNNRTFINLEASPLQVIPALMQPTPFEIDHLNLLSLEALNELQINNTQIISTIQKHLEIGGWSISVIICLIIVSIVCLKFFFKSIEKTIVWEPQIPHTSDEPHMATTLQISNDSQKPIELQAPIKPPRLNDIPFF
ncbi:unnamed protein product [Ceratitis capitata]|uniref:(Mediterranean fruit fly) hypothetical protein n=1 Tax=Ceratitis capitata TaxID=7213 RepID=A0A811UTW4_CERCA|nr:unnamed protein product [Ceratitis capitata]